MRTAAIVMLVSVCACTWFRGDTKQRPKLGAITGLVRDTKTVEVVALAEVAIPGRATKSDRYGMYTFDDLEPGRYTLHARFAGQPVTIRGIEVTAGMATYADIPFTLGDPSPIVIDWGDPREGEIQSFAAKVSRIEGTVGDASTRARVPGAVVTAAGGERGETLQTITDDHGRYRFDGVATGTYAVSAYYSIGGRGQIEVRRSEIIVRPGEGVLVPLWIELAKQ